MKKGIRGHDVMAKGLRNIDQRCKDAGIEYIQLVLEKSIEGFQVGEYSEEYALKIKEELPNSKIAILGSYINPSTMDMEMLEQHMAKFKEKIRYASVLKPIAVGTETGPYIEGKTRTEEAYQHLLKNVKELVAEAEKFQVNVGIEGVSAYVIHSPEMMARLMADVNSDNIKVIFDPYNLITIENYTKQDEMISNMFDLVGDKIVAIHAKDFVIVDKKLQRTIPGEGLLNYQLIFQKMKEKNLDIPIICESIDDETAVKAFERLSEIQNSL